MNVPILKFLFFTCLTWNAVTETINRNVFRLSKANVEDGAIEGVQRNKKKKKEQ